MLIIWKFPEISGAGVFELWDPWCKQSLCHCFYQFLIAYKLPATYYCICLSTLTCRKLFWNDSSGRGPQHL